MNPITAILGLVSTVVSRVWPDKTEEEKEKFAAELQKEMDATQIATGQMAINQNEAASKNMFVAGWRPMVGWVCALAFGWNYAIRPIIEFIAAAHGTPITGLPMASQDVITVLGALLGLGSLRTAEKFKGVAS